MKHLIKSTANSILNIYISFIFRRKTVYAVAGLRRSGNHAFINWFINALENKEVKLEEIRKYYVSKSNTEKTLFFNEINTLKYTELLKELRSLRKSIKESSVIVISLEDYIPAHYDKYIPNNATRIAITRSTLNVIASRIQRAVNQAKLGREKGDMMINHKFISIAKFLHHAGRNGYFTWNFDLWATDKEYRMNFLEKFSLTYDSKPNISKQGGGSSFSGQSKIPTRSELTARWKNIEWPERVVNLLSEPSNEIILTAEEKAFVMHLNTKKARSD